MPTTAEILLKGADRYSKITDQAKKDMVELGRTTKQSMAQAKDATDILKDALGIQLPRELTKIIAQSKLIGPVLAASFNAAAILGFVAAAQQLPALFDKITGAVTGWDEASKKAYDNFLSQNKKALEAAEQFRIKLIEIQVSMAAGNEAALAAAQARAWGLQRQATAESKAPMTFLEGLAMAATGGLYQPTRGGSRTQELANEAAAQVLQTQRAGTIQAATDARNRANEAARARDRAIETARRIISRNEFEVSASNMPIGNSGFLAGIENRITRGENAESYADYWARQSQDFRNRSFAQNNDPDIGNSGRALAEQIVQNFQDAKKEQQEFLRDFRAGVGEVWDSFFVRGQNVLASLANLARGLLNTVGRTLFQNFATGLLTGSRGAGGGIAGLAGNVGGGLGISSGLAGLFGGGSAVAGSLAPGAIGVLNPATGGLITGAAAGSGGIAGALGFGGGAGLLGLGSLTVPIIGGAILGGFLLGKALFGRKAQEAPFTRDPFEVEKNRSIFFFTSMVDALDRNTRALNRFDTMPAGVLVADGMPAALGSSNQFRRQMASTLLDDDL